MFLAPRSNRGPSPPRFRIALAIALLAAAGAASGSHSSPAQQRLSLRVADSLLLEPGAVDDPEQVAAAFERGQGYRARGLAWMQPTTEAAAIPLADIQGGLDEGTLWLGWLSGTDRTLLFAITRDRGRVFSIPGIVELVEKTRSALKTLETRPQSARDTKSAKAVAEELARLVFGDALPLVSKARSLILVPDDPLDLVPFSALTVNGQPLVASRTTTVSLSVSLPNEAPVDSGPSRKLLAIQGGAGEPRLSSSEREIEWLVGTFQGVTLSRADRSVPDSATVAGYEALHFAGRVTYDDDD